MERRKLHGKRASVYRHATLGQKEAKNCLVSLLGSCVDRQMYDIAGPLPSTTAVARNEDHHLGIMERRLGPDILPRLLHEKGHHGPLIGLVRDDFGADIKNNIN